MSNDRFFHSASSVLGRDMSSSQCHDHVSSEGQGAVAGDLPAEGRRSRMPRRGLESPQKGSGRVTGNSPEIAVDPALKDVR